MNIQKNISLAPYSTFRIGGNADFFITIESTKDMQKALVYIQETSQNFLIIGGGSNLVFSDTGFRGVVLLCNNRKIISKNNGVFCCEAGVRMTELFIAGKKEGYDFSVFSTIPGTVGGAVAGNAGLPHHEISDVFISAELFDIYENKIITVSSDFFGFAYRSSHFHLDTYKNRYVIWSVLLKLPAKNSIEIALSAKEYMKSRKEKQPWGKTGGSFFANPDEGAAGFFLEKSGLKGYEKNGAFFSEKHANFMMNDGTATQKSVLDLEKFAKETVKNMFNVELRREVRCIDEYGNVI